MALADIARSMRLRMPWPVGQLALEENDMPRGRGWDKTVEKLSNGHQQATSEDEVALKGSLKEHLLCGEKAATFYRVEPETLDRLRARFLSMEILKSPARDSYPVLLDEAALAAEPTKPHLIEVEETENGVAAVYSSARTITVREVLTRAELPEASQDLLAGFDEIIGLKNTRVQAIDVIYFPLRGRYVDVRIDSPPGMNATQADFARDQLLTGVGSWLSADLLQPTNLFPLLSNMYADSSEGTVVELAFGTTTASLKHEKMRRTGLDLRDEVYHRAGKAALLTPIEPYRLSINWRRKIADKKFSRPELSLFSQSRVAGGDAPELVQAQIRKCMGLDDYSFVRKRIIHHLNPPTP